MRRVKVQALDAEGAGKEAEAQACGDQHPEAGGAEAGKAEPEVAEAEPEANLMRAILDARTKQNLTQKELSERSGIAQAEISKIEKGLRNPTIKLLQRIADGLDMVLQVNFIPKSEYYKNK